MVGESKYSDTFIETCSAVCKVPHIWAKWKDFRSGTSSPCQPGWKDTASTHVPRTTELHSELLQDLQIKFDTEHLLIGKLTTHLQSPKFASPSPFPSLSVHTLFQQLVQFFLPLK